MLFFQLILSDMVNRKVARLLAGIAWPLVGANDLLLRRTSLSNGITALGRDYLHTCGWSSKKKIRDLAVTSGHVSSRDKFKNEIHSDEIQLY